MIGSSDATLDMDEVKKNQKKLGQPVELEQGIVKNQIIQ